MELGFEKTDVFPVLKRKVYARSPFAYNGCILWNGLPNSIKEIEGIRNFKMAVKEHF